MPKLFDAIVRRIKGASDDRLRSEYVAALRSDDVVNVVIRIACIAESERRCLPLVDYDPAEIEQWHHRR